MGNVKMPDSPIIDVDDKEMPVEIEDLEAELSRYFHIDKHLCCIKLINHFNELLPKDLITNSDGDTLNAES